MYMESRKMVLMNPFARAAVETIDIEYRLMDTTG